MHNEKIIKTKREDIYIIIKIIMKFIFEFDKLMMLLSHFHGVVCPRSRKEIVREMIGLWPEMWNIIVR